MNKTTYFPVLLFTFTRLDTLRKTINSLKKCSISKETDLIIFSDEGKTLKQKNNVKIVREYISTITGFKSITINKAKDNQGLAKSIITGVTSIIQNEKAVIVLEDDLVVGKNFLNYMNQNLIFYQNHGDIISISAYSPKVEVPKSYPYNVYFAPRSTSWGWGTWPDKWNMINWDINSSEIYNLNFSEQIRLFGLGCNLPSMLYKQKKGKIDSWAIRFLINQFKTNSLSVYPTENLVANIGFGEDATHTSKDNGFNKEIARTSDFKYILPLKSVVETQIVRSFKKQYGLIKKIFK